MDVSYRISETKFNAWPESLKSAFAPARTLKTGKPGFRLALLQGVIAMKTKPTLLELLRKQPKCISAICRKTSASRHWTAIALTKSCVASKTPPSMMWHSRSKGMETESRLIHRRPGGLRDLYEMACKRGALGVTTVADAFANISTEEAGNEPPHHYRRPAPGRAPWREGVLVGKSGIGKRRNSGR